MARTRILMWVEESCGIALPGTVRLRAMDNPHGDALDSVLAAFATFRALRNQAVPGVFDHKTYLLEGYVYV